MFSFLFVFFAKNKEGMEYLQSKFRLKGQEYCERMVKEIDELQEEAATWLRKAAFTGKNQNAGILLSFLSSIS